MFPVKSARERIQFLLDHLKDPILSSVCGREAAEEDEEWDTEPKTRTPHKDVGKNELAITLGRAGPEHGSDLAITLGYNTTADNGRMDVRGTFRKHATAGITRSNAKLTSREIRSHSRVATSLAMV